MYCTYILLSKKNRKTYTGISNNLERRLKQHNSGLNRYTKRYLPWEIVHTEMYQAREEARKREKYLKSSAGRKWIKKNVFNE